MSESQIPEIESIVPTEKAAPPDMSRREFIGTAAVVGTKVGLEAIKSVLPNELRAAAEIFSERNRIDEDETYIPRNPGEFISRENSDRLFVTLNLAEKYPKTINKQTFHAISQRPARLASIYFRKSEHAEEDVEKAFTEHCEGFFTKMEEYSQLLDIDYISALLMFQISGDNTSSIKGFNKDVRDERVRVAMSLANNVLGEGFSTTAIKAIKTVTGAPFYVTPRLSGPLTVGIHDAEVSVIADALVGLEELLDEEKYSKAQDIIIKASPKFADSYRDISAGYGKLEELSVEIEAIVETQGPTLELLNGLAGNREFLKDLLSSDDRRIDYWQVSRTTALWAEISDLEQEYENLLYTPTKEELEGGAIDRAIQAYDEEDGGVHLYYDQLENPKFIKKLKELAAAGSAEAERLLKMAEVFQDIGDVLIATDRKINAVMADDGAEFDLDFQLITGLAYSKMRLDEATDFFRSGVEDKGFDDPNSLALNAFLATGLREISPSYTLTGERPIHRCLPPYAREETTLGYMKDFIEKVYKKNFGSLPDEDFETFSQHMLELIENLYLDRFVGVESSEKFIEDSEESEVYRNIFAPPHSSWFRSFEATVGYISEMRT